MVNKKMLRRLRVLALAAVMLITVAVTGVMVNKSISAQEPQLNLQGQDFEPDYLLGTEITIPDAEIAKDGKTQKAEAVVSFPDGSSYSVAKLRLSQAGTYTVEYRARIDGTVYKLPKTFTVYKPLTETTSKSDTIVYGTHPYASGTQGLMVSLSYGSTFKFNNVIDLRDLGKEDNFIRLSVVPKELESFDCKQMYIKLTDIYDPENFITVKYNQSSYSNDVVFISSKAHNQDAYYGVENGMRDGEPIGGNHGFAATGSFNGFNAGALRWDFGLSFDNSDNTLYSINQYYTDDSDRYVIDYANTRCFSTLWDGFTTGEVYLSLDCAAYIKASMSFFVKDIAGYDLTQKYAIPSSLPEIAVDYGEYSEGSYPDALIDKPYKVFGASALNKFGGEKLETRVFYGYDSTSKISVSINGGAFIPKWQGEYVIEYTATDRYGKVNKAIVRINAVKTAPPVTIQIATDGRITSFKTGELATVSAVASSGGGLGNIKVTAQARNTSTGKTYEIRDNSFRPQEAGTYKIIYTAVDYVTQTAEKEYEITVTNSNKPIFEAAPELPKYFLHNGEYTLPDLYAADYSAGTRREVRCAISVTDASGTRALPGNIYIPNVAASGDNVTITYKAVGQNGDDSVSYPVKTIDTGLGATLMPVRYFAGAGITLTDLEESISLKTVADKARAEFIRPLLVQSLTVKFNIDGENNAFSRVNFIFTDSLNPNERLTVSYENDGDKTNLRVDGGAVYPIEIAFGGDNTDFDIELRDGSVSSARHNVASGYKFSSGYAYLEFEFEGVTGASELLIKNINGQPLNKGVKQDYIPPRIVIYGSYGGEYKKGDTAVISAADVFDVINPKANVSLRVISPDGVYAKAKDGTVLNDVPTDRDYEIEITGFGQYSVIYSYQDGAGRGDAFTYSIRCINTAPPVISFAKSNMTVKAGAEFALPAATATAANKDKLTVSAYLYTPSGLIKRLGGWQAEDGQYKAYGNSGKVVINEKGVYTVKYFAVDADGNTAVEDFKITVN